MANSAYSRLAGMLVPVFALRHDKDFGIGDTEAMKQAISLTVWNRSVNLWATPKATHSSSLMFS